jgi:hypothetical protein
MAHPVTIADDVGSDFFCTLFEPREQDGTERLFPKNSFAIQVKSNAEKFSATNKIEYLTALELPFFVGAVDRSQLRLSIFSGEYIPIMFSRHGSPTTLTLAPVPALEEYNYCDQRSDGHITLRLPLVCEISAQESPDDLREKGRMLSRLCSLMHSNISARASREYIFQLERREGKNWIILAGRDSAKTFRHNFCLRLAEVFYNFEWILENQRESFQPAEFAIYDGLYKQLLAEGSALPPILQEIYARVSKHLDGE